MESAQEFIQRYLTEKAKLHILQFETGAPFYRNFYSKEHFKFLFDFFKKREANPEQFVSIESGEQTARVFTVKAYDKRQDRHRYNLCVSDGRWVISSAESECFACHGSGFRRDQKCNICDGKGWKNYAKTAT
jgi:hypothetical protein